MLGTDRSWEDMPKNSMTCCLPSLFGNTHNLPSASGISASLARIARRHCMFGSTRYLPVLKDRTLERSEGDLIIPTRNLDQQMCKDQFPVRPGESSTPLLCFYLIPGSDSLNLRLSPLDSGRSSSQNHSIYRPSQISPLLPLCIEPQLRLGFRTSKVEFVHLHYTDTHNHTHVAPHTRHEHMDEPKEKKRGPGNVQGRPHPPRSA
jgi:hypothetical protein